MAFYYCDTSHIYIAVHASNDIVTDMHIASKQMYCSVEASLLSQCNFNYYSYITYPNRI